MKNKNYLHKERKDILIKNGFSTEDSEKIAEICEGISSHKLKELSIIIGLFAEGK